MNAEPTPAPQDTQLAPLLLELRQLEPLIYAANDGHERAHFERLLAPDFWEVGASGKRYDRSFVLDVLQDRHRKPTQETWQTSDFRLQEIAAHHYLLTYTLHQPTRMSRRATLWRRIDTGWHMVYHQGTTVID